jgi:hypothetical protein
MGPYVDSIISDEVMPAATGVVIVGGGIVGTFAAFSTWARAKPMSGVSPRGQTWRSRTISGPGSCAAPNSLRSCPERAGRAAAVMTERGRIARFSDGSPIVIGPEI